MSQVRRGYELKTLFFGRPVRPFHLAVTVATSVVAVSNLVVHDNETFLLHASSITLGLIAVISSLFLTIGWWYNSDWFAEWGLLLAVGVWTSRAVYIGLTDDGLLVLGTSAAVALSLAWSVGAGGAYLLERYDHVMGEEDE